MTTADTYRLQAPIGASTAMVRDDVRIVGITTGVGELRRRALIEDLIEWSTDPAGIDRLALGNVHRDGWGIERRRIT